jgi:peptidoglycan glycosyltransferase
VNSPIRKVAAGCLLLALALLANVTWVQTFQADSLNARGDNRRVLIDQYSNNRGSIIVGNEEIVSSVESDGQFPYQRVYNQPELYAHLTGFYSFVFGRSGIEDTQNDFLAGTADGLFVRRLADLVTGGETKGGSVVLTIDPAAQQAAWDALGDFKGAVVAIEPSTGRILASVSKPSYDPGPLASHDVGEQQAAWDEFLAHEEPGSDFAVKNRAMTETLPPGSVFKLVTAAAALESGRFEPESVVPGPAVMDLPQTDASLPNYNNQPCGQNDETTITNALRISCNTAFGYLGLQLGVGELRFQADKFGFNARPLDDVLSGPSRFDEEMDQPSLAQSAIGQRDVRVTPLQVAMVTAAIANNGVLMKPYLVEEIRDSDLVGVLERTEPQEESEAISPATAQELSRMMVDVVENGTGSAAQMPGIQVGGKTGTAQRGEEQSNIAWFTSFAPADNPQVAVAVVIEEAPGVGNDEIAGGRLAAPVARAVMEAVLGS